MTVEEMSERETGYTSMKRELEDKDAKLAMQPLQLGGRARREKEGGPLRWVKTADRQKIECMRSMKILTNDDARNI